MLVKSFKTTLSIILAVTLCIPLSACQSKTQNSVTSTTQKAYRWENFDDGSDILDLDISYIPSNVENFSFNVILEKGKFASGVNKDQIALNGAIKNWQVENLNRKDDVTLAVNLKKPENVSQSGASIAQIELASSAVEGEATSEDSVSTTENNQNATKKTTEEINNEKGVNWPDESSGATIENKDIDATDEEVKTWEEMGGVAGEGNDSALNVPSETTSQEQTQNTLAKYVVDAVYANPYLKMDSNSLSLNNDKLTFKMKAYDFKLNNNIGKQDLSVINAEGKTTNVAVESAKVASSSELEVVLSVPNSDLNTLDNASLVLAGNANETQSDVSGSIEICDPWLSTSMDYKTDEKAVFIVKLNGTNDKIASTDVKISVNDEQVKDATVAQKSDKECEVTVPASAIQDDAVPEIQVENIENYAGSGTSSLTASAVVENTTDSRFETEEITAEAVKGVLKEAGKGIGVSMLGSLANLGWEKLCTEIFNPAFNGSLYDVSNSEILQKMVSMENQLSSMNAKITALNDIVQAGQYENIINNAQRQISTIYYQETSLKIQLRKINEIKGAEARKTAVKKFCANSSNAEKIDKLALDLQVLYDTIVQASARTGKDLIQVYDDMCALTYNWAAQSVQVRNEFREKLAFIWTEGAVIISEVYGSTSREDHEVTLTNIDSMATELNELINETHDIKENSYKKSAGPRTLYYNDATGSKGSSAKSIEDNAYAYYNYTTGKWFAIQCGNEKETGWDKAFNKLYRKAREFRAETPFTNHSIKTKDFYNNTHSMSISGTYGTTAEVKAMLERLPNGKTLKDELEETGLKLDDGFGAVKYLITSEQLDTRIRIGWRFNNWNMDTFEIANTKNDGSGFTSNKLHFDGHVRNGSDPVNKYHVNYKTRAEDMFILKYVTS